MRTVYSAEYWIDPRPNTCDNCGAVSEGLCVAGDTDEKAVFNIPCGCHMKILHNVEFPTRPSLTPEERAIAALMVVRLT